MESITGLLDADKVDEFLRCSLATLGGRWDADQVASEVAPLARRHDGPGRLVELYVAAYPEDRLFVRLREPARHGPVQEWEYVAAAV